jgi:hypothetical protein
MFSYDTRVDMSLKPGATEVRSFDLDLTDLRGQASGYIPSQLQLLTPDHSAIGTDDFPVDVRGRPLRTVYGIFGLAVLGITALLFVRLCLRLARGQLPTNRWQRGLEFAAPGLGLGLTLTFTLSTLRVVVPSAVHWVPLVLACGAIMFVLGYLAPGLLIGRLDDISAEGDEDADVTHESVEASLADMFIPRPPKPSHDEEAPTVVVLPDTKTPEATSAPEGRHQAESSGP